MTADTVSATLATAIAACLRRSGRPVPRIDPYMRVIDGIPDFDSLCAIETTVDLEAHLGFQLGDNIFIKEVDGRPRARTFHEVIEVILSLSIGGDHGRRQKP